VFSPLVREMILSLKFGGRRDMARALAAAASAMLAAQMAQMEGAVLVPIPLSPQRLAERGFNQSLLLAKQLRKHVAGPKPPALATRLLARQNAPASMRQLHLSALNRAQRAELIHEAFYVVPGNKNMPKKILLVDDVMTTGATMRAAATALRNAGVQEVLALPVARAQRASYPQLSTMQSTTTRNTT
jgi:ComF family protein